MQLPTATDDVTDSLAARVERERQAHTDRDVLAENQKKREQWSHTGTYPSRLRYIARLNTVIDPMNGKTVLDYGCGRGLASCDYLRRGAQVYGIDISPVYVADAEQRALAEGHSPDRFHFQVMDAHRLEYPDATFDTIVGLGILHHLDVPRALAELYRVLKPGGKLILSEPLLDNPLLKLYRKLTPNARTKDELPFSKQALKKISVQPEWETSYDWCGAIEAPVAMLTSVLYPNKPDNSLLRGADRLETVLHRNGWLLHWNQMVLMQMIKR